MSSGALRGNASSILGAGVALHVSALVFHLVAGLIGPERHAADGCDVTGCSAASGYYLAGLTGSDESERRTVAIEVAGALKGALH